tara:strand:+ start:1978 stop:2751 length:774 start_codon:yes stop_codon:yes gene_type:complete
VGGGITMIELLKELFQLGSAKSRPSSSVELDVRRDYYVYFHKTGRGDIFYVGKGTGERAWSTDRHPVWKKYVSERLDGQFEVEIARDGLSEQEAEELEWSLICEHGENLVNWVNPGREFDYEAIDHYQKLRNENRKFVDETRRIEDNDQAAAAERYRRALESMREYEAITKERGVVAELGGGPDWGDPNILDRLTLCLIRAGKPEEAIAEADRYFSEFPSALNMSMGKKISKRVEKLRANSDRAQRKHAVDARTSRV